MKVKKRKSEPPWKKSTEPVLVLYSILAAIAGVFLTYSLSTNVYSYPLRLLFDIPLLFSIILFIYSAEKVTDALDESDVKKLLYSYLPYNFAVVFLIWGLVSAIYYRFYPKNAYDYTFKQFAIAGCFLLLFLVSAWKWLFDIKFLLFANKQDFYDYVQELEGNVDAVPDHNRGMKFFYQFRKLLWKEIIEVVIHNTKFELRTSKINGIGLFAVKGFKEGEVIAEGIHLEDRDIIISWVEVKDAAPDLMKRISDFCVGTPYGFYPPANNDFKSLTSDWYMNHSCNGNIGFNEIGDFIALRDISVNEELNYDYALAESYPHFKLNCTCGEMNCRQVITGNDWKHISKNDTRLNFMLPALKIEYQNQK